MQKVQSSSSAQPDAPTQSTPNSSNPDQPTGTSLGGDENSEGAAKLPEGEGSLDVDKATQELIDEMLAEEQQAILEAEEEEEERQQ